MSNLNTFHLEILAQSSWRTVHERTNGSRKACADKHAKTYAEEFQNKQIKYNRLTVWDVNQETCQMREANC